MLNDRLSSDSFNKLRVFKQHWQPSINIRSTFPFLFILFILFTTLSIIFFATNSQIYYHRIEYTGCPTNIGSSQQSNEWKERCSRQLSLSLPSTNINILRVYILIENMYQNHRSYADSFDFSQQIGEEFKVTVSENCKPFDNIQGKIIVPCGLIPNSLFNDTFEFKSQNNKIILDVSNLITVSESRIYKNPTTVPISKAFDGFEKPPDWNKHIYELDNDDSTNNGFLNKNYITWMRVSPFPGVLKEIGELKITKEILNNKDIKINVDSNYPVQKFSGKKFIVFAQPSWMGLPNSIIGYIYLIVSIILLLSLVCFWLAAYFSKFSNRMQN